MESISSLITEEAKSGSWEGRRRSHRLLGKHKSSNAYTMEDVEEVIRLPDERKRTEKQQSKRPEVNKQWSKNEEEVITLPIPPSYHPALTPYQVHIHDVNFNTDEEQIARQPTSTLRNSIALF
jgi:hypothetical protein